MNQKSVDIWEQNKRAFFSDRLQSALKEWKAIGNGRTEGAFARLVGISNNMVTRYKKCEVYPTDKNLEKICKVLGKPKEYFVPSSNEELYQNSPYYITELGKKHAKFSEKIGLDLDFAKALHNLINYDESFPLYSNIVEVTSQNSLFFKEYVRNPNFAPSASMDIDENLDFLQMKKDGETVTLHYCDLGFLKEVQDQVVEYVEFLFYKRHEEMKREVEEANKECIVDLKSGGQTYVSLDMKQMLKIDRLYKYARIAELSKGDK